MTVATFTEFLRSPKSVVAQTETGAVRITRRDGHDLMLTRADEAEAQQEGLALASHIMRAKLATGDMDAALESLFSWVALFDGRERQQFAADMDRLVWSASELGHYRQLLAEFRSWEGTAEAYADGMTPDLPVQWLDTPIDIPRP
ncbi:MAG: hypothetical protein LBK95_03835 [Bifidobacteriaceae bacterium]|jgi:hypothetical protein|nr:hypothetical protein [Bifidobacteriaceae bacterium]